MMNSWTIIRALAILIPIILMVVMGLVIAIKSGVIDLSTRAGWKRATENFSESMVFLVSCLVGIFVLQHMAGYHLSPAW